MSARVEAAALAAAPLDLERAFAEGDLGACCAAVYEHPAVRWLLGGELHPGGQDLTRRAFELIDLGPEERLLDVASGDGATVLLAAAERGSSAVGIEYGAAAVEESRRRARERGLGSRVEFVEGDAHSLPLADGAFDAVISECSLCTFAEKPRAMAEMHRVLRPSGRLVISDVVAEAERLPTALRGAMGAIACIGEALPRGAHRRLLEGAGFDPSLEEDHTPEAIAMAERVVDRLRGAKVLGLDARPGGEGALGVALELAALARAALEDGRLGYTLIVAERRESSG